MHNIEGAAFTERTTDRQWLDWLLAGLDERSRMAGSAGWRKRRERVLKEGLYLARIADETFELQVPDDFVPRSFQGAQIPGLGRGRRGLDVSVRSVENG